MQVDLRTWLERAYDAGFERGLDEGGREHATASSRLNLERGWIINKIIEELHSKVSE